jgi:hypothetical protein
MLIFDDAVDDIDNDDADDDGDGSEDACFGLDSFLVTATDKHIALLM